MLLQAPTTWLNALIALADGGVGNLRLVKALVSDTDRPFNAARMFDDSGTATKLTDSQIAALINAAGRSIAVPALYVPAWLEIPSAWVLRLANNAPMPQSGVFQLSADCGADFQGAWAAAFQALGFTSYTPAAPGPWPVIAG